MPQKQTFLCSITIYAVLEILFVAKTRKLCIALLVEQKAAFFVHFYVQTKSLNMVDLAVIPVVLGIEGCTIQGDNPSCKTRFSTRKGTTGSRHFRCSLENHSVAQNNPHHLVAFFDI